MIKVLFSQKASNRLIEQAQYIFEQTKNAKKADAFLDTMESYITSVLNEYPKLGRAAPEYGTDIRKLVYKRYSILYRIDKDCIRILTLYRENLPNI